MRREIYFVILLISLLELVNSEFIDPDTFRSTLEIISSRNFEAQEHEIITQDGYILSMQRIVNPYKNYPRKPRPVLLVHGLMDSSASFVMNSPGGFAQSYTNDTIPNEPNNNLGFALANFGYDVWLGNTRGNIYSQKHVRLNANDKKYWNWTVDDIAQYDLTAFISHILNETNEKTLGYVGHSQGTGAMFALLSSQKEYNSIIKPFIALAPVISIRHFKTPIIYLIHVPGAWNALKKLEGAFPPRRYPPLNRLIVNVFCRGFNEFNCEGLVFMGVGFDWQQANRERLRVYASHAPSPTSFKNIAHFVQGYKNNNFARFDYGPSGNLIAYNSTKPPIYDVSTISNKYMAFFYSLNDWDADPIDVNLLKNQLTVDLYEDYQVPVKRWNHMDFVWARQTGKYVNKKVLEVLERVRMEKSGDKWEHFSANEV